MRLHEWAGAGDVLANAEATLALHLNRRLHSATACPSSEAITARLLPLLPTTETKSSPADQADLQVSQGDGGGPVRLRLRLVGADGALIGQRDLPLSENCDEPAENVAVLLASWESSPHTEIPPVAETPVIAGERRCGPAGA